MNKELCAMILAGGQGTRLLDLTTGMAKPAVSFGGRYRIIDFTLSNCLHSQIYNIGILTQYKPLQLMQHIGSGSCWDLDINNMGINILPPYQSANGNFWYEGTANAIYSNLDFLALQKPKYVIILSGDHIYNMDYQKMLTFHKQNNANLTIAARHVSIEEASRFGILNCDNNFAIKEFEEKPLHPKSTLASMGVYIFNYDTLKHYLTVDNNDPNSTHDFGNDIIPALIKNKEKTYAYTFKGYWKDVGTLNSLWQANMDLLVNKGVDLYDSNWPVLSRDRKLSPQYFGNTAIIKNSLIAEGCSINGTVENSIISINVKIDVGAIIKNSVILPNSHIQANCHLDYCLVARDNIVPISSHFFGTLQEIKLVNLKGGIHYE